MGSVYKAVSHMEDINTHWQAANVGRQILSDLTPSGWARDQQSLPVTWIHEASGATCRDFPLMVELSVRIYATKCIDRSTVLSI